MRDVAVTEGDKVEAELRFGVSVNTYGVNDLVAAGRRGAGRRVDALVAEYADAVRRSDPELGRGGDRHESLRYAAQIEAGLRQFLTAGGFGAFTTNFEDLGGLRQLPGLAVQRLMADGYGFGGEGDWKTSALLAAVKAMGAGTGRGTSFMEDYTYHFGPGEPEDPRRAHARGLPDHRGGPAVAARSTRSASAAARTRSGWSSTPRPARAW